MAKTVSIATVIMMLTILASNNNSAFAQLSTTTTPKTSTTTTTTTTATASKYNNVSTTTQASGLCLECCQYNHNDRQLSIKLNVDVVFSQRQQIDLIFIIKNSQGFEQDRLSQVLTFVSNLVTYLQLHGFLIVHPDYGRVAILTFADNLVTPIVDGINAQSGAVYNDACRLQGYINSIVWNQKSDTGSNPYNVLIQAQQIFVSSQRNATRVVFYFDNGANWLTSGDPSMLANLLSDMRFGMNVQMFAAGVGLPPDGWMSTGQLEHNVQSISSGVNNYYACMDDWSVAISNALNTTLRAGNSSLQSLHLYTVSPISQCQQLPCANNNNNNNNPSCGCSNPDLNLCACDVISQQYVCQACQVLYPCVTSTTTSTTTTTTTSTKPVSKSPLTTTYVAIIAAVGGFLVIIIVVCIVICCYCCCCCCCKKREKEHPAPMPPPPRKRRAYNDKVKVVDGDDCYYGNAKNGNYDIINESEVQAPSPVAMETMQATKRGGRALEQGMPGWSAYLEDSAVYLTHLCIIGLSGRRWAQTPGGRFVRTREARAIHDYLNLDPANRCKKTKLRVAGADYDIDWDHSKPAYSNTTSPSSSEGQGQVAMLRAWRLLTPDSEQREVVLACSAHNYVSVGICTEISENECEEAVKHMIDYVGKSNFQDDPDADVYAEPQQHRVTLKRENTYVYNNDMTVPPRPSKK